MCFLFVCLLACFYTSFQALPLDFDFNKVKICSFPHYVLKLLEGKKERKLISWSGKLHIWKSSPEFNGDLWVNPDPFALASLRFNADSGCWPRGTAMWSKLVLVGGGGGWWLQDKRPEQRDWNPHQLRKQMARKDLLRIGKCPSYPVI